MNKHSPRGKVGTTSNLTEHLEAHPDLARVASLIQSSGLMPPATGGVKEVRKYLEQINSLVSSTSVPLLTEQSLVFVINGRSVPCTLYWPDDASHPGLLFYCHGGGFRHGSLAGWDAPLRQIVRDSGAAVLSIGYALAPEYPFPTAFEEVAEICRHIIDVGVVGGRAVQAFALGGDSAGANLALGAAVALMDGGTTSLSHLMLFYGVYSMDTSADSWRRLSGYGGYGLSVASMTSYWGSYVPDSEAGWRVQPILADMEGLPPVRLTVGELDPLLDDNRALAAKLLAADVPTTLTVLPGIIHGVVRFSEVAPVVREMISAEALALSGAFSQASAHARRKNHRPRT